MRRISTTSRRLELPSCFPGARLLHQLLDSGTLVVSHQVEYLKPVTFSDRPLTINLWVDAIGGSRFSIGYEVYDGGGPGGPGPHGHSAI